MRIQDVLLTEKDLADWKASRALCLSNRSDSSLGASALSSCRSQGLRSRNSQVQARYGGSKKRRKIVGKIRGKQYGGSLPDWS